MQQALDAIRELQDLRGILPEYELASRARAIFEREGMKRIDLGDFLNQKGYTGYRLAQAVGTFGKAVKSAYVEEHGVPPIKAHILVNGDVRPVAWYLEMDRNLIETVFATWSA